MGGNILLMVGILGGRWWMLLARFIVIGECKLVVECRISLIKLLT